MTHATKILTIALALVIAGCGAKTPPAAGGKTETAESAKPRIVTIGVAAQRESGITVGQVARHAMRRTLVVPGRVEYDQQRVAHLTSRVAGRVEQVHALLGDRVKTGQLLATIYSQEYLTTQAEFIQALRRDRQAAARNDEAERRDAHTLLESVRRKLAVIGASEDDIRELSSTLAPATLLRVRSTITGTVTETSELLGHAVEIGALLFHIADLSRVWIAVDINEKDLGLAVQGAGASAEVAAWPGERFTGRMTRIFDVVDEKSRTIKARVEVENRGQKLKPGMFTTVALETPSRDGVLAVPADAVQREGDARFVFVAESDTTFVKTPVAIGQEASDLVEITDGLTAGMRVVTRGAFTLKSEMMKETFGEGE